MKVIIESKTFSGLSEEAILDSSDDLKKAGGKKFLYQNNFFARIYARFPSNRF